MKTFLFIGLLISFHVHADDLSGLYTLSEDVRDVLLSNSETNPMPRREFNLTTQQADQMVALTSLDEMIVDHVKNSKGKDCDQKRSVTKDETQLSDRIDGRKFEIEALILSSNGKYEQNALGRFTANDYINYMGRLSAEGNFKAGEIFTIDSLINRYKAANPKKNFSSMSFKEKEEALADFAEATLKTKLPEGLLMKELAFTFMVNNSKDWKSILEVAKDKLSNEQKIQLVSKLGGFFGNNYNYQRKDAGSGADGEFVTIEALLDSVKNNTAGGVCRDIALAQTQILNALGFQQSYVVGYKTASDRHATVITVDPSSGKIIKFNYAETYESKKGSGTEALVQETTLPDHGLNYRIYDSNGTPVTKVPSELALILKSSAGGEVSRDFNQRNYSLNSVAISGDAFNGNLFTGKTSSGDTIYGLAVYKNGGTEHVRLGLGASLSKVESKHNLVSFEQQNFYVRSSLELSSPDIKLGETSNKLIAGGETSVLLSNTEEHFASGRNVSATKQMDADTDMYVGVQNSYSNHSTSIDNQVYVNFYPDLAHEAKGGKAIVKDSIVLKSGVSHALSDETRALIDTAVVIRNYGTNIVAKATIEDSSNGTRYTTGLTTPVTRSMPSFLPGGETRAFASVERMSKRYSIGIEFEKNFDNGANSVMVKGQVKF